MGFTISNSSHNVKVGKSEDILTFCVALMLCMHVKYVLRGSGMGERWKYRMCVCDRDSRSDDFFCKLDSESSVYIGGRVFHYHYCVILHEDVHL
jgi:hypothetical protein